MSTFKKSQVVMLSTNEKATLWLSKGNTLTLWGRENPDNKCGINQHLYILSDEEIKEGDWVYSIGYIGPKAEFGGQSVISHGWITQVKKIGVSLLIPNLDPYKSNSLKSFQLEYYQKGFKKIIATTDTSLGEILNSVPGFNFPDKLGLPQPSKQFIEIFVKEYNKGNIITEVMVEYEEVSDNKTNDFNKKQVYYQKLKINPKDNTITIRKVKDSWNKEEVKELLEKWVDNTQKHKGSLSLWEWIEENL